MYLILEMPLLCTECARTLPPALPRQSSPNLIDEKKGSRQVGLPVDSFPKTKTQLLKSESALANSCLASCKKSLTLPRMAVIMVARVTVRTFGIYLRVKIKIVPKHSIQV